MDLNLRLDDWIGRTVDVVIDRPLCSVHPNHPDVIYGINYSYIPGTTAPDGHPIDAYVLGADHPLKECSAKVIAVIRRGDDIEDKIVAAMRGEWDIESIEEATAFQERWFDSLGRAPTGLSSYPQLGRLETGPRKPVSSSYPLHRRLA